MARLRVSYNAPVVLTLGLLAVLVYLLPASVTLSWFSAKPPLELSGQSIGLVTHILGHASWEHLLGNLTLILLVGPLLEERYGSPRLLAMILVTALVTGLVHTLLFSDALLGASAVAFMMIVLASTVNRQGDIPLTFIAVAVIFLGGEVVRAFRADDVSQLSHIVGGLAGAGFGFLEGRRQSARAASSSSAAPVTLPHDTPSP